MLLLLNQNKSVTISFFNRRTFNNQKSCRQNQPINKKTGSMDNYETLVSELEKENITQAEKRFFWENSEKDKDCANLTVAKGLSLSIMTIFEIDSIEMEEGFIY